MNEIAHGQRVEHQGIVAALGRAPAQAVAPDEAQRVAQQYAERACRLGAIQDGMDYRMIPADGAVMGRDLPAQPVGPATRCGHRAIVAACKMSLPAWRFLRHGSALSRFATHDLDWERRSSYSAAI